MKERYKEMKKRIRVAVKRMICLITICAMVVGTCPLPVIAAEDEGVSNDVVTEVDSASADSATDDNSAPIDSSTDDNPASINSSTDDNPVPTDSSTDDDTTPTELTTDDDAAPTEPTTDEDATQSEPTTDEDATQPEPTTVVNPVDTIELTVNDETPEKGYTQGNAFGHFAFEVDNMDKIAQKVAKLGYEWMYEPFFMDEIKTQIAFIKDPDGNEIEFIEKQK